MGRCIPLLVLVLPAWTSAIHIIQVIDGQTNRGVPLVELETTGHIRFVTDSAGIIAFDEPGLLDRKVWFSIKSHGYEFPADGFGFHGTLVETKDGGKTTLKIKRLNLAERLYRITGQGIYDQSVRADLPVPTEHPVLNGEVVGQDSVQLVEYRGQLHWFWGDTGRVRYPLGHFAMSGAVSDLPRKGGLDPAVGVNLHYFVDKEGFSRPMMDVPGDGLKWAGGLMVLNDESGRQRLVCSYARLKSLSELLERSLAIYNDQKDAFEKWKELDKQETLYPDGQPLRVKVGGAEYFYFPCPYALTRVKARWNAVGDVHQYESFTCLVPGTRYRKEKSQLERDSAGQLVWEWKKDTGPLREDGQKELIKAGLMKESEGWYRLKDIESGKPVMAHGGSVCWNDYRKKYVMLFVEIFGTSVLGEVWYAEADKPEGPWLSARKIVTHDKQTFYNPVQHPQFDQDGGRVIYFEGTYCNTFSGNAEQTPRYDYNQIMYRLDLSDPRMKLDVSAGKS